MFQKIQGIWISNVLNDFYRFLPFFLQTRSQKTPYRNVSCFWPVGCQVVNTLSASAPGGASIIFGQQNPNRAEMGETTYPFNHSSMGAFLESCRGAKVSITLDSKISKTGLLLMVERAQRVIEGSKDKTEEYFASLQIFEEGSMASIRKIPFQNVVDVSLVDPKMQDQLSKSLLATLEKQLPKPLPLPKDHREIISIRARTSENTGNCQVSYVETRIQLLQLIQFHPDIMTSVNRLDVRYFRKTWRACSSF